MDSHAHKRNRPNARAVVAGVIIAIGLLWLERALPGAVPGMRAAPASDLLQIARSGWVAFATGFAVFVGSPLWGRARMTDAGILALLVTMMCLAISRETEALVPGYAQVLIGAWGALCLPLFIAGAGLGAALRPERRRRRRSCAFGAPSVPR